MNKYLTTLLLGLFLINLVSAVNQCGNDNAFLGTFKVNEEIDLYQACDSCTYVNLTSVRTPVQIIYFNDLMTKTNQDFNYTYSPDEIGCYSYTVCGDKNGEFICEVIDFEVTPNGQVFTIQKAVGYIGFILILLFIFILDLYYANKIEWKHKRNKEGKILSINNLRYVKVFLLSIGYVLMMFLFGLSYKLFNEAGIEGFTDFFYYLYIIFQSLLIPIIILSIVVLFTIFITNKKLLNKIKLGL